MTANNNIIHHMHRRTYTACGKLGALVQTASRWVSVDCPDCLAKKPDGRPAGIGHAKQRRGPGAKSVEMMCVSSEELRRVQAEKILLAIREGRNLASTVKNMLRPLGLGDAQEQVAWLRSIGLDHGLAHRLITGFMLFTEEVKES